VEALDQSQRIYENSSFMLLISISYGEKYKISIRSHLVIACTVVSSLAVVQTNDKVTQNDKFLTQHLGNTQTDFDET